MEKCKLLDFVTLSLLQWVIEGQEDVMGKPNTILTVSHAEIEFKQSLRTLH